VGKLQYGWCSWLGNELPAWVQGATTLIELVGGACLALGFMTPIVAVCIAAVMLGSILQFHLPRDHMFVLISGEGETWELNATYLTGCLVLATQGAGDFSCDGLVKRFFRHL
jgi:putative oxidoreductase